VAWLARHFGATPTVRARVSAYLRSHGATGVRIDATSLLAEATLKLDVAERLFRTRLARFHAVNGGRFVAPAVPPTVPLALQGLVAGVVGLDTRPLTTGSRLLRARLARLASGSGAPIQARSAAAQASSYQPRSGTPAGCPSGTSAGEVNSDPTTAGFTPNQYLGAYDYSPLQASRILGQGERVALVEIDGYTGSDISTFAQCFGLALPPITPFGIGVSHSLPPGGEATLDLEILDAAAPGLKGVDVYETKSDSASVLQALVAPLQNPHRKPQVVSASLGLCEQDQRTATGLGGIAAADRLLELATAAGVSYLAATGDQGSADCTDANGVPRDQLAVNYPASSRWVTGVGGTNLVLTPANQISAQYVWNDTTDQLAAGGGGFSTLFRRPAYQRGVVRSNSRAVPDVSMLADLQPGYAIYCTVLNDCESIGNGFKPWLTVGGTSAGTPLLAGGVALVDQVLRAHGRADVGLANPLLYLLGGSSARRSVFSDVISIGNDVGPFLPGGIGPLGCCTAKVGYDEASGWGSVDLAHLAQKAIKLVPYVLGGVRISLPPDQHPLAHGGLLVTVTCSRACLMGALATVRYGHNSFSVHAGPVNRPFGGGSTIELPFSGGQRHALAGASSNHVRIIATVYGLIVTPDGAIQRQTAGRSLSIRG
jgi:kumamolisin